MKARSFTTPPGEHERTFHGREPRTGDRDLLCGVSWFSDSFAPWTTPSSTLARRLVLGGRLFGLAPGGLSSYVGRSHDGFVSAGFFPSFVIRPRSPAPSPLPSSTPGFACDNLLAPDAPMCRVETKNSLQGLSRSSGSVYKCV